MLFEAVHGMDKLQPGILDPQESGSLTSRGLTK